MGDSAESSYSGFGLGQLDLLLTSPLGEKMSFLNETVFEFNDQNETVLDVERTLIKYDFAPYFMVSAGRFHTALGYWNDAYHHGSWIQTSISRPGIYHFEDEEGILPIHSIGLEPRGNIDHFGYIVNISNGRGRAIDPPTSAHSEKSDKAANILVYAQEMLPGLRFGLLGYSDKLPASTRIEDQDDGSSVSKEIPKGSETILGAHLVYIATVTGAPAVVCSCYLLIILGIWLWSMREPRAEIIF